MGEALRQEAIGRGRVAAAVVTAAAAMALAGYLTVAALGASGPLGCGQGSGCGEVLASRWSKLGPVPVSAPAAGTYAAAAAGLVLAWRGATVGSRRAGWTLATVAAGAIAAAAGWFTYLQAAVLGAICPYCMAGHALGLVLAGLVLWRPPRAGWLGAACGVMAMMAAAGVQTQAPGTVHRVTLPTEGDYDITDGAGRHVGLMGGTLRLTLADEPVLGPHDAQQVIALMYDHACPHCRHTHEVVRQVLGEQRGRLAVVLLPVPLEHGCNPHAPEDGPERFGESCERTRIALAVHEVDASQYAAFDAWMFETGTYRSAAEARARAEALVGAEALATALAGEKVNQKLVRNVHSYGEVATGRLPVTLAPWAAALDGRVEDAAGLRSLIEQSATSRP